MSKKMKTNLNIKKAQKKNMPQTNPKRMKLKKRGPPENKYKLQNKDYNNDEDDPKHKDLYNAENIPAVLQAVSGCPGTVMLVF